MHMNNSQRKSFLLTGSLLGKSICGALLISFFLVQSSLALPFGKKDADNDEGSISLAIPQVKLTRDQQNEFDTSLKNGGTYLRSNNFELALICYMRCSTLNPASASAHLGLASCNVGLRKTEQAQNEIFEALRCDPNSVPARDLLGKLMMADNRWDEAGGQFFQILKQQPENLEARGNLASCLQMMGQLDAAVGQYKYILDKNPKIAMAAFNLAAAYNMQGDLDNAMANYKKVIELEPKNTNAYCSLAKCLILKNKDFANAQVLLKEAMKQAPNYYYVHLNQGYLNEVQGDIRSAIEEYTKAAALAPQDPDSQKSLQHMLETGVRENKRASKFIGGGLSVTR